MQRTWAKRVVCTLWAQRPYIGKERSRLYDKRKEGKKRKEQKKKGKSRGLEDGGEGGCRVVQSGVGHGGRGGSGRVCPDNVCQHVVIEMQVLIS